MKKHHEDLLVEIQSHPQFEYLLQELERARPIIPVHDPLNDNTSQWKQRSAMQAGFDCCLSIFKINLKR